MGKRKKEIRAHLETLYALRFEDYRDLIKLGDFEAANAAFNDCREILDQLNNLNNGMKARAIEIGKAAAEIAVTGASTAVTISMANKVAKFEETGVWTSTGGKVISSETFKRLASPKRK